MEVHEEADAKMIRSFIVLLLLVVVFLSGMLVGIDREKNVTASDPHIMVSKPETPKDNMELEGDTSEQASVKQELKIEGPEQSTQKMASFLEAGVKGFYEVVVEVLYQISSLFI